MSTLEDRANDARQDRITDDQAEREDGEARAEHCGFEVGDHVTIGKGKKVWVIESFWSGYTPDKPLARLQPLTGYTATSAEVDRLQAVQS